MQYTGLARKYPVGRPLSAAERERQLRQKERLEVEPAYQLSVIRLNSTYMELVDKFFAWKGFLTTFSVVGAAILAGGLGATLLTRLTTPGRMETDWLSWLGLCAIASPGIAVTIWTLLKESFAYTHYPIRLNRRTRMVHVFRTDGTVLSVPWDEVFFCIGQLPQNDWEIQGHVLDADGVTVRETFAFSYYTVRSGLPVLRRYWEFVRRYMEEGPQDAAGRVEIFLDIADKKETLAMGFHRMHAESGINIVTVVIGAMIAAVFLPGRWIAVQTSRLPVWPREIDDACRVQPDDPYIRDVRHMAPELR